MLKKLFALGISVPTKSGIYVKQIRVFPTISLKLNKVAQWVSPYLNQQLIVSNLQNRSITDILTNIQTEQQTG